MNKKVAVIQVVRRDLQPRYHGLEGHVFSEMPKSQYSPRSEIDPYTSLPDDVDVILKFDQWSTDRDMVAALQAAFDGRMSPGKWQAGYNYPDTIRVSGMTKVNEFFASDEPRNFATE